MSNNERTSIAEMPAFDSTDAKIISAMMAPFLVAGTAIATTAIVQSNEAHKPLAPNEQLVYGFDVGLPAIAILATAIRAKLTNCRRRS